MLCFAWDSDPRSAIEIPWGCSGYGVRTVVRLVLMLGVCISHDDRVKSHCCHEKEEEKHPPAPGVSLRHGALDMNEVPQYRAAGSR